MTFKNIKHNSLLCAEGILLEDLIVDENVKVLEDCLFCVHLQRQYSAARELEEFKLRNSDDKMQEPNTAKYFQALQVKGIFFFFLSFVKYVPMLITLCALLRHHSAVRTTKIASTTVT